MTTKLDAAVATQWANIQAQSGRSRQQWIALALRSGHAKHGELVAWLKSEFGLGHGNANLIAQAAKGESSGVPPKAGDDLVASLFAEKKAGLRPLWDKILAETKKFGSDVEIAPKKTYVSLRRSKQFALVQPSTAERLDLGLNLKGVPPAGRLEASGTFNAMCTHRIRLGPSHGGIDADVKKWLRNAYLMA